MTQIALICQVSDSSRTPSVWKMGKRGLQTLGAQARQRCGVVLRRPRSDAHGCAYSGPRCHSCARRPQCHSRAGSAAIRRRSRTLRSHPDHTHAVEPATAATPAAPPVRVAAATGSLSPPGAGQQRLADSERRPFKLLNRAQTQSINLSFILRIQFLILLSRRLSEAPCPQVGYCALRMRKVSLPPE